MKGWAGIAVGAAIGIVATVLFFLNLSLDVTRYTLGALFTVGVGAILAIVGLLVYSGRLRRDLDLRPDQVSKLISEYLTIRQQDEPPTSDQQDALQTKLYQVGQYLVSIVATIRAFGFLFGAATVAVSAAILVATLMQVERLDQQNQLSEASRRAALINELTAILTEIDEELDASSASDERMGEVEDPRPGISPTYVDGGSELTKRLVWRIIALSRSLRPYRFLEDGVLSNESFSPERGQLLISLVASGIKTTEVFRMGIFDTAYLRGAELSNVYLADIKLSGASLQDANLITSNLKDCICRGVNFDGAILFSVEMSNADVSNSSFRGARLPHPQFWNGAKLENVDLEGALVGEAAWLDEIAALVAPPQSFDRSLWRVDSELVPWFHDGGEAGMAYRLLRANTDKESSSL